MRRELRRMSPFARAAIARPHSWGITSRLSSLELTIQADPRLIQKMRVFSKKRNATSYDSAGNVSRQELEEVIGVANELEQSVTAWLRENHPELTKGSQ